MAKPDGFYIGQRFRSYVELDKYLKDYSARTHQTFSRGSSKSIEKSNATMAPKSVRFSTALKYSYVKFTCVKYGMKSQRQVKGLRPNHSTIKSGCPAFITIVARKLYHGESWLQVKKFNLEHNHELDEFSNRNLPQNRRLTPAELREVDHLVTSLQMHDVRILQDHIALKMGKLLPIKDIHNIKARLAKRSRDEWTCAVEIIKEFKTNDSDAVVDVLVRHGTKDLEMIILQSGAMRQALDADSEVIQIDSTYSTNKCGMPMYAIMITDGASNSPGSHAPSRLAAVALTMGETPDTIFTLLDHIVANNSSLSTSTKVVVVDDDLAQLDASVNKALPNASTHLNANVVLKSMRSELSRLVSDEQVRGEVNALVTQLVLCTTEEEFTRLLEQLSAGGHADVIVWLMQNWLPAKHRWAAYERGVTTDDWGERHVNISDFAISRGALTLGSVCNDTPGSEFARIAQVVRRARPLNECLRLLLSIIQSDSSTTSSSSTASSSAIAPAGVADPTGFLSICVDYAQKAILSQLNSALCTTTNTTTAAATVPMSRKRTKRSRSTMYGKGDGDVGVGNAEPVSDGEANVVADLLEQAKVSSVRRTKALVSPMQTFPRRGRPPGSLTKHKTCLSKTAASKVTHLEAGGPSSLDKYAKALNLATRLAALMSDLDTDRYEETYRFLEQAYNACSNGEKFFLIVGENESNLNRCKENEIDVPSILSSEIADSCASDICVNITNLGSNSDNFPVNVKTDPDIPWSGTECSAALQNVVLSNANLSVSSTNITASKPPINTRMLPAVTHVNTMPKTSLILSATSTSQPVRQNIVKDRIVVLTPGSKGPAKLIRLAARPVAPIAPAPTRAIISSQPPIQFITSASASINSCSASVLKSITIGTNSSVTAVRATVSHSPSKITSSCSAKSSVVPPPLKSATISPFVPIRPRLAPSTDDIMANLAQPSAFLSTNILSRSSIRPTVQGSSMVPLSPSMVLITSPAPGPGSSLAQPLRMPNPSENKTFTPVSVIQMPPAPDSIVAVTNLAEVHLPSSRVTSEIVSPRTAQKAPTAYKALSGRPRGRPPASAATSVAKSEKLRKTVTVTEVLSDNPQQIIFQQAGFSDEIIYMTCNE